MVTVWWAVWWDGAVLLLAVAAGAILTSALVAWRPGTVASVPAAVVPIAAVVGAAGLAMSDAAPTGWSVLDVALRMALGALVPVAAARAGWFATTWLCAASVVVLVITEPTGAVAGAVAVGAAWSLEASGLSTPRLRAVFATVVLVPLGLVDWPLASGVSAVAVAVAVLPVLFVALIRTPAPWRGRIVLTGVGLLFLAGLGSAAGLAAALTADDDVERAVAAATRGLDLLGDDSDAARTELLVASDAFADAETTMRSWWARPALMVPVVAQQARAVSTMASAGADLSRTAADAAADADVDTVRPRDGRVDLDALASLTGPLERSLASVERASSRLDDIRSPLLLGPVADRLDTLESEVDEALESATLAVRALEVAPGLLGADGPRHYFVSVQNPSEITGNGGFMGNWAELEAVDGRLQLARSGRVRELLTAGRGGSVDTVPEWTDVWGQYAASSWGVFAFSPDNPTVSRVIAERYPESGGNEVDGVITLTPEAFAALLSLTGPIEVEGYPDRLSEDNAEQIMVHEQYLEFAQEDAVDREEFLQEATSELFTRLLSQQLPGPRGIAAELGSAVESRALQLWSADPAEQALFERMGADGSVARSGTDSFGVVTQNFNGSKIDWFSHRTLDYEVAWDPGSGDVSGTLTATIRNDAPETGFPDSIIGWGGDESLGQRPVADGENFMDVTVYTALPIRSLTVAGEPVQLRSAGFSHGHHYASFYLSVPSRSERVVVAEVSGTATPGQSYEVRAIRQPTINPDELSATISVVDGWTLERGDGRADDRGAADPVTVRHQQDANKPFSLRSVASSPHSATNLLERLRGTG